jgi:S-adenosylmethionine hydrolase
MPEMMVELDIPQDSDYFTFATRDRFIKAAVHLAEGKEISELGMEKKEWSSQINFNPVIAGGEIRGLVIYVDNYENVITNITEKIFNEERKGRKYSIECRGETIRTISKSYLDVPVGEIVALFGSTGHLELAMNQGNASSLLGLYLNDPVRVVFQ